MNPSGPSGETPSLPQKAPVEALPELNEGAEKTAGSSSGGVLPCKKKTWFGLSVRKVDEKNKETAAPGIVIDLKITSLGEVQKTTSTFPIRIANLDPGGTGEVLQMTHATDVYEAIGDFT